MQATVILHVAPADVHAALPSIGDDPEQRRALSGETVRVRALEDCVTVDLGSSLTDPPAMLIARMAALLGPELLLSHDEKRGIPAYPSSHSLAAKTWSAALEELGEAAEWLNIAATTIPDLSTMFGPEGAAIAAQLQGPQGAELMQQAMAMAQQLMQGGQLEALMGGQLDLEALKGQAQAMLDADPELEKKLRDQLGSLMGPPADDEDD